MITTTVPLEEYTRDRRRLNATLSLLIVGLIPLPAILLHARFKPLEMLVTVVAVAAGVGIVYPVCWRSKHHPYRGDKREKRTRLIALTCRTAAFTSLVGFMVSWAVGSTSSAWVALAFLAVGTTAIIAGFEVELRWNRILRRRALQIVSDAQRETGPLLKSEFGLQREIRPYGRNNTLY